MSMVSISVIQSLLPNFSQSFSCALKTSSITNVLKQLFCRCYKGFSDDDEGFYAVYRSLFETICEEDQNYSDEELDYPTFGDSDAEDEVWQEFYAFFSAYITPR